MGANVALRTVEARAALRTEIEFFGVPVVCCIDIRPFVTVTLARRARGKGHKRGCSRLRVVKLNTDGRLLFTHQLLLEL